MKKEVREKIATAAPRKIGTKRRGWNRQAEPDRVLTPELIAEANREARERHERLGGLTSGLGVMSNMD